MALDPIALAFQNAPVQYVLSPSIYVLGLAGRGTPVRIPPSAFGSTTTAVPGTGTVTSVGLTAPSDFSVSGSPVSTSGDLGFTWNAVAPNLIFAGPASGGAATPTFRAIVPADLAGTPAAGKYWDGAGVWTTLPPAGTGTVTSVGIVAPTEIQVTGSPVTTAGNITLAWNVESANLFFAGPGSGPAGTPSFRAIVWADVSSLAGTSGTSFCVGNDARLSDARTPTGAAGGDLTGTYPNPTIALLAVTAAKIALLTITDAQVAAANKDGVAGTASMRTLGTGAQQAAAGNDTRFPASVTGVRLGAGAGSSDTAAVLSDILAAMGSQSANLILAGPVSGGAATAAFRALVPADIGTGTPAAGKYVDGGTGAWTALPAPGTGTVTSVGLSLPSILTVSGSPVTTSGTLTAVLANQNANLAFLGPASGAAAAPTFRAIVPLDLATGGSATNFYRGDGVFATPTGTAVGFLTGKDRNRPSATTTNVYQTTDTIQTYISDGTKWYVAGSGWDKVSLGRTQIGGMGDSFHLDGPPIASGGGPEFTNPYTFLIGFYVVSLPGAVNNVMVGYGLGNSNGWYLASSTVNANKLAFKYIGVNAGAVTEMSSMSALTVGFHAFCMTYDAANVKYCLDGGTVNTVAATGAATALSAASFVRVGSWTGGAGAGSALWFEPTFIQGFASVLSNADMQTLTSLSGATYRPGITSNDPKYDWQVEWFPDWALCATLVNTLTAYGTGSSRNTYLTPVGAGGGIKTRY